MKQSNAWKTRIAFMIAFFFILYTACCIRYYTTVRWAHAKIERRHAHSLVSVIRSVTDFSVHLFQNIEFVSCCFKFQIFSFLLFFFFCCLRGEVVVVTHCFWFIFAAPNRKFDKFRRQQNKRDAHKNHGAPWTATEFYICSPSVGGKKSRTLRMAGHKKKNQSNVWGV